MKSIGRNYLLIAGAIGAILGAMPAASAQDVSGNQGQQYKMQPGIRYTTGAVTTAGWEKTLTDGDPNLRRWNWSAMTTYTQSCYNKVPPGAFVKKNQKDAPALRPTGSIYVKPVHIAADAYVKKDKPQPVMVVGTASGNGSVSGQVRLPKPVVASVAPAAKSYNVNYVSGTLSVAQGETLATRQVHGRLIPQ